MASMENLNNDHTDTEERGSQYAKRAAMSHNSD
jgi:hypothetical protein